MKFLVHARLAAALLLSTSTNVIAQGSSQPDGAASSRIDALLAKAWQKHHLTPNAPAGDETFVRRIYLDIAGRIPTATEAQRFITSSDAGKRSKLIDELLDGPAYPAHMFHFFADLLRVQSRANGGQGEMTSKPYVEHVKRRVRENMPYDALVRELLTAQGKVWDNAAIGYYMRDIGMPLDNLANTTRVFLGTRIECAQCHDHPFDKWTQMQFYQMAAFTYPLETNFTGIAAQNETLALKRTAEKQANDPTKTKYLGTVFENLGDFVRYSKVQALPSRVLKLPHDYRYRDAKPFDVISPATMLGESVHCTAGADTVKAFADWLTSPNNPRFTTVIANRLWKKVFGLGLIEPVDELMEDSDAVNPELMRHLERVMVRCGYDLKAYLRVLFNTQAYQRDVTHTEHATGETYHFTGPLLRRMTAEQIYDSFVTLIHPTPDLPRRQGIDDETAERLTYRGKLSDALDLLTAREIFDGAMKASERYDANATRAKILRDQFAAAQKTKDKPLMEKLNVEIRALNFTSRQGIHENVVVPAVARLYTKKTNKPAPPPPPVQKPTLQDLKKAGIRWPYINVPGYEMDQEIPAGENTAAAAREAIFRNEAKRFGIPADQLNRYLSSRRRQASEWPRAIDLESPAPCGHYLREFGQSDRELIENANFDASVPQALLFMNSELFQSMIKPWTQLMLNVAAASNREGQLAAVYLTLLSRTPNAAEKAAWQKAQAADLTAEDLVYALINTQQFIFVQ